MKLNIICRKYYYCIGSVIIPSTAKKTYRLRYFLIKLYRSSCTVATLKRLAPNLEFQGNSRARQVPILSKPTEIEFPH